MATFHSQSLAPLTRPLRSNLKRKDCMCPKCVLHVTFDLATEVPLVLETGELSGRPRAGEVADAEIDNLEGRGGTGQHGCLGGPDTLELWNSVQEVCGRCQSIHGHWECTARPLTDSCLEKNRKISMRPGGEGEQDGRQMFHWPHGKK